MAGRKEGGGVGVWIKRLDAGVATLMAEPLRTRRRSGICRRINRRRSATDGFHVRCAQWSPLAMQYADYGVIPGSPILRHSEAMIEPNRPTACWNSNPSPLHHAQPAFHLPVKSRTLFVLRSSLQVSRTEGPFPLRPQSKIFTASLRRATPRSWPSQSRPWQRRNCPARPWFARRR
jgi:hypothetical protein